MYDGIEAIDYVIYLSNNDNKLHVTNLTDKKATTENTGDAWYKDAYGNCLIALKAHTTDKLYLMKKDKLKNSKFDSIEKAIEFLEINASKTVMQL